VYAASHTTPGSQYPPYCNYVFKQSDKNRVWVLQRGNKLHSCQNDRITVISAKPSKEQSSPPPFNFPPPSGGLMFKALRYSSILGEVQPHYAFKHSKIYRNYKCIKFLYTNTNLQRKNYPAAKQMYTLTVWPWSWTFTV